MSKFFLDTEFIEGFHKPLFGKRRHFIDLISIGIVAQDGRKYEAISTEFRRKDADTWVRENVIDNLPNRYSSFYDPPDDRRKSLLYKSNEEIAKDIIKFCTGNFSTRNNNGSVTVTMQGKAEFYAYYADYDWVVLCSLFGRMIDLPDGFPMYCKDLKQSLDEMASERYHSATWWKANGYSERPSSEQDALEWIKNHPAYPKISNEHNALSDAKWNKELYDFIRQH